MSSSLWPDSKTRKMYGQAGLKQQIANQRVTFTSRLAQQELLKKHELEALKQRVKEYENLKWYKKLWLAIREWFGYKQPIIS